MGVEIELHGVVFHEIHSQNAVHVASQRPGDLREIHCEDLGWKRASIEVACKMIRGERFFFSTDHIHAAFGIEREVQALGGLQIKDAVRGSCIH